MLVRITEHFEIVKVFKREQASTELKIRQLMAVGTRRRQAPRQRNKDIAQNLMVEKTGLDGPKVDKTAVDEIAVDEPGSHQEKHLDHQPSTAGMQPILQPLQCMSLKHLQLQVDITGVVVLIDKNMEYVITDESDDSDVDTSLQYSVK